MEFSRRPKLDFRVEISPLIDVVFLLLIFFMVSTTFVEEAALDIQLPESGSTVERPDDPFELVVKADGSMVLGERQIDMDRLEESLREAIEQSPGKTLMLKGDKDVPHGTMVRVYDAIRAAGGSGFVIDAVPDDSAAPSP